MQSGQKKAREKLNQKLRKKGKRGKLWMIARTKKNQEESTRKQKNE